MDRQKRIKGWDQAKIQNSTIMVIGAGAIGNELVKNLVLTGIGKIFLIDYDFINPSNLNRCILFSIENAKQNEYKADVIKEACANLNPNTEIISIKEDLNDIDRTLYKKSDVICSCVDNIEARLEANNYAYYYKIPFVDAGIEEFYGSIQSVYSKVEDAACLQCNITDTDLDTTGSTDSTVANITSTNDTSGITIPLTETGPNTGIFTGSFTFSTSASNDPADIIKAIDGDTIFARYDDEYKITGLPGTATSSARK